ncbi:MAG: SRPBCC domain-containing protein [Gemmatimonadales bacterium]
METIVQHSVILPGTPAALYAMYLDPAQHAAFTGGPVTIAAASGAVFEAFGGRIHGVIVHLTPGRQIVQTWRSFEWAPDDLDSLLVLSFWPDAGGTRLDLAQVNVPERLCATLQANWPMRYLDPWREYLASR